MNREYQKKIEEVREYGGMLDVLLALQGIDGYITEDAVDAVAASYGMFPSQVYETASFYGMLSFQKPEALLDVRICRGAPCHVAGSPAVIAAVEKELGIQIGQSSKDGTRRFGYTECQGQCQSSPALLINGRLHTGLTPQQAVSAVREAAKGGA